MNLIENKTIKSIDYMRLYQEALGQIAVKDALILDLRKENHQLRLREVPLSNHGHEYLSNLQCKVKGLSERIKAFETGDKYIGMKATQKMLLGEKDREINKLKSELAATNANYVTMRENWWQVFGDMAKEHDKEMSKKDRELKAMEKRALSAERRLDESKVKLLEKIKRLYEVETELEDEKGKNQKLKSQINRDHENSSNPSSKNTKRKKIVNSREKTDKKPGAQPGHDHHPRKWHTPTNIIELPLPKVYADDPEFKPTGRIITKQLVDIEVKLIVNEYSTAEYRNSRTGERVHAEFPDGLVLDVTYGGNIKSLAFLLNNYCNVSIEKTSELLSELTGGELNVSAGMINGLAKQFSQRTEAEQKRIFADMQLSPVMNIDFTTAHVNGKQFCVTVCATDTYVLYFAREHKGHEGVKGTPAEYYYGILVHDHESTFYSYGDGHQECLDHILRYLKDSMITEANLKWNIQMRDLIREMIHWRKHLDPNVKLNPDEIDPAKVADFESRYDEILNLAEQEYGFEPPSKYYKDGFNLYLRMKKYKMEHLLFLHDRRVPYSNSLAERRARLYKRKEHQVMTFRSFGGLEEYCESLSIIETLRSQNKNLYESISTIFAMPIIKTANTVYSGL